MGAILVVSTIDYYKSLIYHFSSSTPSSRREYTYFWGIVKKIIINSCAPSIGNCAIWGAYVNLSLRSARLEKKP